MTDMYSSNRRSAFFYLTGLASNHRRLTIRIDPLKKDFFTYHNNNYRLFSLYMQLGNDFTIKKKYFNVKHKINIMPVKLVTPALFIQNWANFFSRELLELVL